MPKKPIDYSKGLIYSIVCKTDETLLYIGSTTNFRQRKSSHKSVCYNEKKKSYNFPVYVMIRANGGWDNFEMKPIKEFPCENNIQLVIEEERIKKEMNANLNTKRAYRTEEELKADIKKHNKEYREEHKNYDKEYREEHKKEIKEYNMTHKKEIKECQQKYYQDHKDEIKEKSKKYREEHKEDLKKYHQKRYLENKDKINEKRQEKAKNIISD